MSRWHVWFEGASREDAAEIEAPTQWAAANTLAAVHKRCATTDFEIFVSPVGGTEVHAVEFMIDHRDAPKDTRDPWLVAIEKHIAEAKRWVIEEDHQLSAARKHLAEQLMERERCVARLARAERDDAPRRPGPSGGGSRRRGAAGE